MRAPTLPYTMSQPFCVIVVYDKATNVPSFAFTNYAIGALDSDTIKVGYYTVPLVLRVEDIQYTETRPASLGNGLHRRECSFTIKNDGPFTLAPFAAGLYSAGVNTDSFYFGLFVTDFSMSLENIMGSGMFFGYFDLDGGLGWDEATLTTSVKLIDRLTNLTGRYATATEEAEEVLQGSEWQRLLGEPTYLGYKGSVPAYGRIVSTIDGFDTYQDSVIAVIAGIVTQSELSGTSIQLGKSPGLAQFVGDTVKLKMGNGCIVTGTIVDLTGGDYGLDTTGLVLNDVWDTIKAYNRGWLSDNKHLTSGEGGADLSSIFLDGGLLPPGTDDIAQVGIATASDGPASEINDVLDGSAHVVTAALPIWFKIDLGAGNETMIGKMTLSAGNVANDTSLVNFQLQGSVDDSVWDVVYTGTNNAANAVPITYTFTAPTQTKYRYYRLNVTSRNMAATKTSVYRLGLFATAAVPGGTSLDKLPSPFMYVKTPGPVELYSGGVVTTAGPLFCKLTGVKDDANKELGCEPLKDPANNGWKFGGISVEFDGASPSSNFSDVDLLHLNYAKWLPKGEYGLYFTDKTYTLADIQKSGMPWELIATKYVNSTMVIEHVYYIKLAGPTTIAESASGQYAVYASNGQKLILIPNSEIVSIVYNCGDFTLPDLCRITLKRALIEINESFDPNMLYVDTYPPMHGGEVIAYILDAAGIPSALRAASLQTGSATLGNPLGVTIKDETWSELLDSVVFESGLQIDAVYGAYAASASFTKGTPVTFNNIEDPTQTFQYVPTDATVSFNDVVDGTYKMNIGRMYTNTDAAGREYIRVHYKYDFVYSQFNGERKRTLQSTRAPKSNDRLIEYSFKHVVDTATATAAASQMQRIGHAANIPESTRIVEVGLPLTYIGLQLLDTLQLVDFRHITRIDDPLPYYDENSATNPVYTLGRNGVYYKYTQDIQYALIPGIGIVDAMTINFSGTGPPVQLTFKQMQVNTSSNIKAVAERVEILNDSEENVEEGATEDDGGGGYPGQLYRCPPDTSLQNVIITPGEVKSSSTSTLDACCNSTSTGGDVITDPSVTVICVGVCTTPEGCPDDNWPTGCVGSPRLEYEPHTDYYIDNFTPLEFDIVYSAWAGEVPCPNLVEIRYPGKATPDYCVTYTNLCQQFELGNPIFGMVSIPRCVFNSPANMPVKAVELVYDVPYCQSEQIDWNDPTQKVKKYIRWKRVHIAITILLRPPNLAVVELVPE